MVRSCANRLEGLVLFVWVRRTQFITGSDFIGGKVGDLAMLLGYERGEYLIPPFDLLYFRCKVKVLYIIYQYLF